MFAAALPRRTPRFLSPGNDTQLGSECISQRRDEREFGPHLARGATRRIECSKIVGAVGFEPTKPLACKQSLLRVWRVLEVA